MLAGSRPWLCQGDVFIRVPCVRIVSDPAADRGFIASAPSFLPAVLLTHGCQLDKRNSKGLSTVGYLHFAPVAAMSVQSEGLQTVLRKEELNPARAMFIGEVPEFGDCLIQMGETVSVPVDYFGPQLRQTDDFAASPDDRYLFATKNGDRFGRLTDTRAALLRNKLAAYWSQIRI